QSRMIWTVAHVYHQRPGLREMLWLYANVGATVFAAQAVEDLDLGEVLEPMIAPALATAAGGSTVVLAPLATIIGDSLLQGTANALLTLRVGCIAKRYCHGLPLPARRVVRRAATREAAGMLGSVVVTHAGAVVTAMWTSGKRILADRGRASVRQAARIAAGGALGIAIYEAVRRALASVLGSEGRSSPAREPTP
ncbi:MAG: YcjF family protein, partial [Candidatus Rokubacteria bacterium]|nr:YcjF family protein [Candidatus Rokubacteria bacterium]